MSNQVQMTQRGVIVLPKQLREAYRLTPGMMFTLIDLGGGAFVLMPKRSEIDEIADSIRDTLASKGETLESMLIALREKRERHGQR